jgi:hypothetical protein
MARKKHVRASGGTLASQSVVKEKPDWSVKPDGITDWLAPTFGAFFGANLW